MSCYKHVHKLGKNSRIPGTLLPIPYSNFGDTELT